MSVDVTHADGSCYTLDSSLETMEAVLHSYSP